MTVPNIPRNPTWDTWVSRASVDGRLESKAGGVWLYRQVPMAPVRDATDRTGMVNAGLALAQLLEGLGSLSSGRNRQVAKSNYREFHLLWVNVPVWFHAPSHLPTAAMLNRSFRDHMTLRKELVVGVRLIPSATRDNFIGTMQSVLETFTGGSRPMSDYDRDYNRIAALMQSAGFDQLSPDTLKFMQSWWTHGDPRAVPVLPHDEHMHFFTSLAAKRVVEDHYTPVTCTDWNDHVDGQFPITFANLQSLEQEGDPGDRHLQWAIDLADRGARVISVRGLVEPAKITRVELRQQAKGLRGDRREVAGAGKDDRAEMEELEGRARDFERSAALGTLPATLVDTSVIVGFDGAIDEIDQVAPLSLRLTPMTNVQPAAWHETMLSSPVRSNPVLHDLSVDAIAHAGLQDRTVLGDAEGAHLGFTADGQSVYVTSRASTLLDAAPLFGLFGKTGAGKTIAAQWLAYQWSHSVPVVFIDPKPGSDLRGLVDAAGGRTVLLDSLIDSDGALDPITNFPDAAESIPLASKVLGIVTSIPRERYRAMETDITAALQYGIAHGARATGQALVIARDAGKLDREFVDAVERAANVESRIRAVIGFTGQTSPLRIGQGLTLFMAGSRHLDLPPRKASGRIEDEDQSVRSTVNLLRMLVRSTLSALRGTSGVAFADEAHVLERAAPDELDDIGRLARQWELQFAHMTQTPSGPARQGLSGYFSHGLIAHISDESEARAALKLLDITDGGQLDTITAAAELGGGQGVNYKSLLPLWRHLPDGSRELIRPGRVMYRDLHSSVATVEVRIPDWFFKFASTNPDDRRAWEAEQEQQRAEIGAM